MLRWYFDIEQTLWIWRLQDDSGCVLRRSKTGFRYYLDAVADAREYGFEGRMQVSADEGEARK
jgi:hypothetical protein